MLVLLLGLIGLGLALYELLSPESGTAGTGGAMLVVASTALLAAGAALGAFVRIPAWLVGVILALLLVDAAATAVAGYFLMSEYLVATMLAALIATIAAILGGSERREAAA